MYTNDYIDHLIKLPKSIVEGVRDRESRDAFSKRVFTMLSEDGIESFSGFINQNTFFQENYSIGLVHISKSEYGKVLLLRCNGIHGAHRFYPHHLQCHIHKSKSEFILEGLKPESNIILTTDYTTLDEAIQFFIKEINLNIDDRRHHFPPPSPQMEMPF